MKRQYGKIMQHIAALTLGVFLILSSVAQAADNTAGRYHPPHAAMKCDVALPDSRNELQRRQSHEYQARNHVQQSKPCVFRVSDFKFIQGCAVWHHVRNSNPGKNGGVHQVRDSKPDSKLEKQNRKYDVHPPCVLEKYVYRFVLIADVTDTHFGIVYQVLFGPVPHFSRILPVTRKSIYGH